MAAKKRCQFQVDTVNQCSSAALRIVGECGHCQAQFCGSVSTGLFSLKFCSSDLIIYSIDFLNITIAPTWRTAASRHSTGTNQSWRVSAQWLPRWVLRSFYTTRYQPGQMCITSIPYTVPHLTISSVVPNI
jgi:hypothetical protein